MKRKCLYGTYFCGNEASEYGKQQGYLDYRTLAKSFDAVLSNNIIQKTTDVCGWWDLVNGSECYYINNDGDEVTWEEFDENGGEEIWSEVYQYFIISDQGAQILQDWTDELVWYNGELDLYVWGVTHYGTSWDYVLTDIKLNVPYEDEAC